MKVNQGVIYYQLLSALSRGNWLIDLRYAAVHFPMVYETVVNNKPLAFSSDGFGEFDRKSEDERAICRAIAASSEEDREIFDYWLRGIDGVSGKLNKRVDAFNDLPENSLAVIRNIGPMMKNDAFCGPAGSATLGEMIASANRSSRISAIIYEVDSPGGHVDGTEELSRMVVESKKPVVGLVNGLAASAGYWSISGSNHIISMGATSETGSIGTMISFMDLQPYYESLGVKFHTVRASKSVDKNEDFYQMLKGKYEGIIKNTLDPLNEVFINNVKANRPSISESVFTGKTYLSKEAQDLGLTDETGTFEDAVAKAYDLAGGSSINHETTTTLHTTMKFNKAWSAALAFLGFGESVAESDLPEVTQEHLERLNSELERQGAEITQLTGSISTLTTEKASLEADRDAWKQKAEEYGSQPGAMPSNPVKIKADAIEGKSDPDQEAIDNLQHNKDADKLI